MGAFTNAFDTTNPQGSNAANALDSYIRTDTKQALVERSGLEHYSLDGSIINGDQGANESIAGQAANGQGRHIPGKVGCLFYGTTAERDAIVGSGIGSIAYTADTQNFWYLNAGGSWNILAINSDTIFADELSLTYDVNTLKMLRTKHQWTTTYDLGAAGVSGTINTDCTNSNSFEFKLTGAGTLANPTNPQKGATYLWIITQDATGSRTLGYGVDFKFSGGIAPVLSTAPDSIDMVTAIYDGTYFLCSVLYDFS